MNCTETIRFGVLMCATNHMEVFECTANHYLVNMNICKRNFIMHWLQKNLCFHLCWIDKWPVVERINQNGSSFSPLLAVDSSFISRFKTFDFMEISDWNGLYYRLCSLKKKDRWKKKHTKCIHTPCRSRNEHYSHHMYCHCSEVSRCWFPFIGMILWG